MVDTTVWFHIDVGMLDNFSSCGGRTNIR